MAEMTPEALDAVYRQMAEAQGLPYGNSTEPAPPEQATPPSGGSPLNARSMRRSNSAPQEQDFDYDPFAFSNMKESTSGTVPPEDMKMTAKKVPNLGKTQSFFGQFNDAVLYLPDAIINKGIEALELTGVIDNSSYASDVRNKRNYLSRVFNASDFATKEKIAGTIFNIADATGEQGVRDPYAAAAGEGAALGLSFAGGAIKAAGRLFAKNPTRYNVQNPEKIAPKPGVAAAEAEGAYVGMGPGTALEGLEAPIGWSTRNLNFVDQAGQKALTPFGGGLKDVIPTVKNWAPNIGKSMLEPFAAGAALPVIAETAANVAGNVATEAEKEYTPFRNAEDKPYVTGIPALITGGVTSGLIQEPLDTLNTIARIPITGKVLGKVADFVGGAFKYTSAEERDKALTEIARKNMDAMKPAVREQFERAAQRAQETGDMELAAQLEEQIPGISLSFAERTSDPFWRNAQELMQKNSTVQQATNNLDRVRQNVNAAFQFFAKNIPSVGDNPAEVFASRLKSAAESVWEGIGGARQQAASELENILSSFPGLSQEQRIAAGRQIQERIDGMKQTVKEGLLDLSAQLKLDKPMGRAQLGDLKASLAEKFKVSSATEDRAPKVIRDLRDLDSNTMNFQDYLRFRMDLGSAIGSAAAKGGRGKEITDLEFAKKQLDNWAENAFPKSGYAAWRDRWVKEYVAPFEDGLVMRLTNRQFERPDMPVRYQLQGEMVAEDIIKQAQRGKIDDFNNYLNLVDSDPTTMKNLRNAFLDDILGKVYNPTKGEINPQLLKSYVKDNEVILDRLGMKNEIENMTTATEAAQGRLAGLDAREKVIKRDQLVKILEAVNKQGMSAEETVDYLTSSPARLGEFWTRLKTPGPDGKVDEGLLESFKASVLDKIFKKYAKTTTLENNSQGAGPEAFKKAIEDNKAILQKIMTPEEFKKYMLVNDALFRINYATAGLHEQTGIPLDITEQISKALGTKVETAYSMARQSYIGGKVGPEFIAIFLGRKILAARNQEAFDNLIRRAMTDKDFVDVLSTPLRQDGSVPLEAERKLRGYMMRSMIPMTGERTPSVDYNWDPEQKAFVNPDTREEFFSGRTMPPPAAQPVVPVRPQVPIQIPTVAPVPVSPAPAPVSTPAPAQTTPPQPRPLDIRGLPPAQQNQTPGRQGMMYQNMFPNDPLGSLLAAKRAG